jgi:hypothetical protein
VSGDPSRKDDRERTSVTHHVLTSPLHAPYVTRLYKRWRVTAVAFTVRTFEFCGVGLYPMTRTRHFLMIPPAG